MMLLFEYKHDCLKRALDTIRHEKEYGLKKKGLRGKIKDSY